MQRISSDRWRKIEELFHQAAQCGPEERCAFLDRACGTDSELRREVESLLASLDENTPFLESAVQDAAGVFLEQQAAPIEEDSLLDRYRVLRMLAAGGMGEVYLAEDTKLKRKVALKMLPSHLTRDASALRRLEHEAQVVSSLNHANLLTVFEFCQSEGRHFLVTEFIDGETVRQIINRGRLEPAKAVDIASQAAAGLSAAHASGVIHRDIKPDNIIVRADGGVKVVDFGIAKLTDPAQPGSAERGISTSPGTMAGAVLGTPRYMSPEQARGIPVDKRTDLFSLGAVLYEMLTGKAPFRGATQSDLIADILRTDPPPIRQSVPATPKRLQSIVSRALAKDSAQRYQSAESLLSDLQQFRRDDEFRSRPKARILRVALAVLMIACIIAAVFVARKPAYRTGPPSPRSLAVLPFRNLKPDPDTDFLGFSLADEVIAKLGYVKALTVRPSSAIRPYREGAADLRRAAAGLKADMLLTGSFLKDGEDLAKNI